MAQRQMELPLLPDEEEGHQSRADHVGNYRCVGDSVHGHVEAQHKEQIQTDVDYTGNGESDQRSCGVSAGAENGRGKIVNHDKRRREEIDPEIEQGEVHDVCRRSHSGEERPCHKLSCRQKDQAADEGNGVYGGYGFAELLFSALTDQHADDDVYAERKPNKERDDQVDRCAVVADGRQRGGAGKASDHGQIRTVEKLLQDARQGERQGKEKNLSRQRAVQHIHVMRMRFVSSFCH